VRRLACLVGLVVLGACAGGTAVRVVPPEELPDELYGDSDRGSVNPRQLSVVVYFVRTDPSGTLLRPIRLGEVSRQATSALTTPQVAMRALLEGPTTAERARFRTAIPAETQVLGVTVNGGVADVNLTAQFEAAEAEIIQLVRVAQVVWTLTELPDVDSVRFRIHGVAQPVIDERGVAHDRVGRGRYSGLAPQEEEVPALGPAGTPAASPTPAPLQ
jgi:spore germination protein GerM